MKTKNENVHVQFIDFIFENLCEENRRIELENIIDKHSILIIKANSFVVFLKDRRN